MPNIDPIRLDDLNQEKALDQEEYRKQMKRLQLQMLGMQLQLREMKRSVIVVMEGPDAAGKGGAIKRVVERLDPRQVRVYSIVKPTPEEFNHHYMWRFWTKFPALGEIAIFDRSWYGRVLVERVEGFCSDDEWKRAYREINECEKSLAAAGAVLVKIYLHISKDEQLKRFKSREADPYKHWKISEEDWRNRRHWDEHNRAAEEMFVKTGPDEAPWTVIPANYKWYARVRTLKAVCRRVADAIGGG